MNKAEIVANLFDTAEQAHALEVLREAAETGEPAPGLLRAFRAYVITPLEAWQDSATPGTEAADAATVLWFAARDVLERLRDGGLHAAHVAPFAGAWKRFHMVAGYDATLATAKASITAQRKRQKRKTWKGLDPAGREARDSQIVADYLAAVRKNSQLTINSFAEKYASTYNLKVRRTREIIEEAVGS
ncbi:hypothetical protein ACHHRT_04070 [Desulfurivibrio sp. D14AmB]|uniref:hypothetical protein n=1 Tax=Desulfurivibrio sp. D14AmB TaxID=3374370 RepID=UPI00376F327C